MKSRLGRIALTLTTVLVLLSVMVVSVATAGPTGPGDPGAGTVVGVSTSTMFATKVLTASTTTTYTQRYKASAWYSADVFVTADVANTDTLTVTAQVSADGTNWANAWYVNASGTTLNYQFVISSDVTEYQQMPIVGEWLRFRLDNGGTVTPTIKVTFHNDGGK
jgi:hypothetical protein